jgi:hypothetical protein
MVRGLKLPSPGRAELGAFIMTIQTTNIDANGDAVDLTSGDEVFYVVASGVAIESQFANGIVAENTQNFFIYNNGTIVANEFGVERQFGNDHFYNERGGSVFGFEAVVMSTTGETFVNYGDVSGDIIGVFDSSGGNTILNYGTIEGPNQSLNVGGVGDTITNNGSLDGNVSIASHTSTLTNSGSIDGAIALTSGDTIDNVGTIDGAVKLVSGGDTFTNASTIDGAVTFTGTGVTNTFTNSGSITGTVTLSGSGTVSTNTGTITGNFVQAEGTATITNHGHIYGNVTLAAGDTLTNTGVIHGNVTLGAGDTINSSRGEITGSISASTSDTFDYAGLFGKETINGFKGGTVSTHDTIQFAADDFGTFTAVQAAMSQVGTDTVIRLDATDSITLAGITKTSLVAADFHFV